METNGLMARTDRSMFVRTWLREPLSIGAVLPSSRALAELMTSRISPADGPVVELGAGTGVFTRALIRRGVPEHRLTLIEANREFARSLVFRFPQARVLNIDAAQLNQIDGFFGGQKAGTFVSGLPLASMPARKIVRIVVGAFRHHLRRGGAFYQFTYLPRCPLSPRLLERNGLRAERIGWVFANLPPAQVFRIARAS